MIQPSVLVEWKRNWLLFQTLFDKKKKRKSGGNWKKQTMILAEDDQAHLQNIDAKKHMITIIPQTQKTEHAFHNNMKPIAFEDLSHNGSQHKMQHGA